MTRPMFSFSNETDPHINAAAYRLVEQMAHLDAEALKGKAAADPDIEDECLALPMWNTYWLVSDSCDKRAIERLCCSMMPEDEDEADALLANIGIDVEEIKRDHLSDCYECRTCQDGDACSEPELDEEAYVQAAIEAWDDCNSDDYWLARSGWQVVAGTGILALEVDGDLVLGIDGAGYSFADSHWIPLYKELGYGWHKRYAREARIGEAARDVAAVFSNLNGKTADLPPKLRAALQELQAAYASLDSGRD